MHLWRFAYQEGITFSDQNKNLKDYVEDFNTDDPFACLSDDENDLADEVLYQFIDLSIYAEKMMNELSAYFHAMKGHEDEQVTVQWLKIACDKFGQQALLEPLFETSSHYLRANSYLPSLCDLSTARLTCEAVNRAMIGLVLGEDNYTSNQQFLASSCAGMGIKSYVEVKCRAEKVREIITKLNKSTLPFDESKKVSEGIIYHKCRPLLKAFDFELIEKVSQNAGRNSRHRDNLEIVLKSGDGMRLLAQVDDEIKNAVLALADKFPNFREAIGFYADQLSLSALTSNKVFSSQPLLLAGPPGVGKTAFIHALASVVGVGFEAVDMSTMSGGFVLSGNSYKWENGSQGIVLKSIRDGEFANPVIFLDEIDKVAGDRRFDPTAALHLLLEQKHAENFVDESIDVPVNASKIVWVAAANDIERISKPILSRFAVIHIDKPQGDEMHKVIQSVWESMLKENDWGGNFEINLKPNVKKELQKYSPREVKKKLLQCCGRIASRRKLKGGEKFAVTIFDLNSNASDKKQLSMH